MRSSISKGHSSRLKVVLVGTLGAAGLALAIPGGASAATVDCSGAATPPAGSKGKAFALGFKCVSPQGDKTTIEAFSVISNHEISGFNTEPIVINPSTGETVVGEQFGCEGEIPGDGFGCFGKASLGNEVRAGFNLTRNPCSKRTIAKQGKWRLWVVASAPKINPTNGNKTPAVSEPLNMKVPVCEAETTKK